MKGNRYVGSGGISLNQENGGCLLHVDFPRRLFHLEIILLNGIGMLSSTAAGVFYYVG